MQFVFLNQGEPLVMPVTPPSYQWAVGRRTETLHLSDLGEVFRPGGRQRFSCTIPFMLPAQPYPFMEAESRAEPQYYLDRLNAWASGKAPVQLIITGTAVNNPVYIESVTQSEKDGSGDIYVDVSIREYVELTAQRRQELETGNLPRPGGPAHSGTHGGGTYTIRSGDTLSAICRRHYGHSTARYYTALAKVNGIRNPHLIYPGRTIRIPTEAELLGGTS